MFGLNHFRLLLTVVLPPTNPAWRAHWTEEDELEFRNITHRIRVAKEGMGKADPESAAYWEFAKVEIKMVLAENELKWQLCRRVFFHNETRMEYQWAQQAWLKDRAKLENKRDEIEKMVARAHNRDSLLSLMKMDSVTPDNAMKVMDLLSKMEEKADTTGLQKLEEDLKNTYGTKKVGSTELIWSPVEGDWRMPYEVRPTHILPFGNANYPLASLFKQILQSKNDIGIDTAANGLFLPPPIEEAIFRHQVTLAPVPVAEEDVDIEMDGQKTGNAAPTDAIEWKLLVVDKSNIWDKLACRDTPFSSLHGRALRFRPGNSNRPLDVYVYIHYLISVLKLSKSLRHAATFQPNQPLDVQAIPELLGHWPNEKTPFGENIEGVFQTAMARVRQRLLNPEPYGQSLTSNAVRNEPGFQIPLNWRATPHHQRQTL
ncbi:hypothetical protein VTO42DRAFT_3310 [Malbranchea cinnamomea]